MDKDMNTGLEQSDDLNMEPEPEQKLTFRKLKVPKITIDEYSPVIVDQDNQSINNQNTVQAPEIILPVAQPQLTVQPTKSITIIRKTKKNLPK